MKLLLANDDGINAEGLYALAEELQKEHELIISAPDSQRSASSHSITINRPLTVKEVVLPGINCKAYSVDGTPADCVRIALDKLVDGKVDMVISGINRGLNIGTDVLYSGTVSAAIEAAIYKVPSVAVSLEIERKNEDYKIAARYASMVLNKIKENGIGENTVLNINVPGVFEEEIKGIKVCKIGSRTYANNFVPIAVDGNAITYSINDSVIEASHEDTDTYYIEDNYVTLTPLHYDFTNFNMLNDISKWFKEF